MVNTPIGIDTLHLTPQWWRYEGNFGAVVQPPSFDSRDGTVMADDHELFAVQGQKFSGPEALLKLKSCALALRPHYDHRAKESRVNPKFTMTVPTIVGEDNYFPASLEQLQEALSIVQAELAENGFVIAINNALIQRLDATRTFQTCDAWVTYRPVLAMLKPSRMTGVSFPTGQRWSNPRCEIEFYEKGVELASHYPKVLRAEVYARYPANSVRAELRWMQHVSFQEATGMRTVSDLLADFSHVQDIYRKQMKKRILRNAPAQFDRLNSGMSVAEIVAEMRQIHANHRSWFREWCYMDWARHQNPERIEIIRDAVRQCLSEEGLKPQNAAKKLRKIEENHIQHAQLAGSARSVADIYRELREKVLAD